MPFLKLFISLTLAFAALKAKAQTPNPSVVLSGKYQMHLKINDRLFIDYLNFNCTFSWSNPCLNVLLEPQVTALKGYLEVPNIFKASLQKAIIQITDSPKKANLSFEILAKENGQEFKVYYKAIIPDSLYEEILSGKTPPTFIGTATLDDNKILGEFTAVKIE